MIGETVSRYRILEKIGEGGMSVVYRAEDTKLKRTVALKFLSPRALGSKDEKTRFLYEAQAAAALDHSNICTIHEIDEAGDATFIAMAYVEGLNLRDRIESGPLDLDEAVGLGVQIAQGLQAAHEKDIIHRDIKSANIMVTPKGEAKIMDFGLAKLPGRVRVTTTGTTVGTVAYMSPEQARGEALDYRTDIWSFGVVLYEMVSGRLPFTGDYEQAVAYRILNEDPQPLSVVCPGVPPELDGIMGRLLAKRVEDRYQSVKELLSDLRKLKKQIEIQRYSTSRAWEFSRGQRRVLPTLSPPVILVGAAAIAVALVIVWLLIRDREGPIPPGQSLKVTSADAWHRQPEISPDGGRIAYVSDVSGNPDVYVIDIRGGNPLQLTYSPAADEQPTWFPDGSSLAFVSGRGGRRGVWKVGQLGGSPTLLLEAAEFPAISPDGRRVAFSRDEPGGNSRIAVASLANPSDVTVLTGDRDGLWDHRYPVWSPDGKEICYATRHDVWIVPSTGGKARPLTSGGNMDSQPAWAPDGRHVYFSSYREGTLALWRVSRKRGRSERVSLGTGWESEPSLCRDGTKLVYSTRMQEEGIAVRDMRSGEEVRASSLRDASMPAISPDRSKMVFISKRWGTKYDLWVQPLEQDKPRGEPRRLTDHEGGASHPAFSPDGKWIAYYRIMDQERSIWTIPVSGGRPTRFSEEATDVHPCWSPDGSMLAFASSREGGTHIWTAPVRDGSRTGPARRITSGEVTAQAPTWSPDGKWIAFLGIHSNDMEAWIVPADGSGPPQQVTQGARVMRMRWDSSTGGLLVSGTWGRDEYTLSRVFLDGRETEDVGPVVQMPEGALFDVSPDGRLLAYPWRNPTKGHVWVLEAEQGTY
ncbi:MAG: serine/threonine-protein kinase [Candidatus Eiseniibacteriota bacterium]|nr:MAG: serine/threonine-protein kinase [Candidatus Eisenbacteria bacterium]